MKELLDTAAREYALKHSAAPDRETPDWIINDFKAGAEWAVAVLVPPDHIADTGEKVEESQEELWAKIIFDARHYNGTPHDLTALTEHFKKQFTITRRKP